MSEKADAWHAGKKIVPDIQLEKLLLETAGSLPTHWDRSHESKPFVTNINARGGMVQN